MRRAFVIPLLLAILAGPLAMPSSANSMSSQAGALSVTPMADGFRTPWSVGFLPDGSFLVTEREGRLWRVTPQGQRHQITGLPEIRVGGQGGLLDLLVPRDFDRTGEIIFSFAKPQGAGEGTAMAIARLSDDRMRLENLRLMFEMAPGSSGGQHFGGRIVEAPDGALFLTIGDRGNRDSAQDLRSHNGTVVRINRDGSVPSDNPFVTTPGALPEIFSFGHRNPQGATLDGDGNLWLNEHGARGGDEVNLVRAGVNYGWPVIAYGVHYSGAPIGEGTAKEGMAQPALYWDPSMAPSGMVIYTGDLWPAWQGQMFVGSLKFDYIARLDGDPLRGTPMSQAERISSRETARVRDIRQAPDGSLWFISEQRGTIYRVTP